MHWDSKASGVISDEAIVTAYAYFNAAVYDDLPGGTSTLMRIQELSSGDQAAGRKFVRDLGHVVGAIDELRKAVHQEVRLLDTEKRISRILAATRKRAASRSRP